LQFVKEQTEEICLEVMKQNGEVLQYITTERKEGRRQKTRLRSKQ
jgi:hypothetical protein